MQKRSSLVSATAQATYFRKMRLLMENIKPVGEPGATGSIFIFIFRKGWPK